ncbi:hypothetical protein GCM10020358_63030 [Amorphoplanes nipponensis]
MPRPHVGQLSDLPARPLLPGTSPWCSGVAAAVPAALSAQGTFVAMNNVVSQSGPHLHTHIVPRTKGDGLRGFFCRAQGTPPTRRRSRTPTG